VGCQAILVFYEIVRITTFNAFRLPTFLLVSSPSCNNFSSLCTFLYNCTLYAERKKKYSVYVIKEINFLFYRCNYVTVHCINS
jgi:hypothetical protein